MADNVATETGKKASAKTGTFFQKHKTTIFIVGGIVVAFILYMVYRGSGGGGTTASTSGSAGGVSNSDLAGALQGLQGGAGPAGAAGAPGAKGPTGAKGPRGARGPHGKRPPVMRRPKRKPGDRFPGGPKHVPGNPGERMHPGTNTAMRSVHYTVKPGETSTSVAVKHNMDVSTLHGINPVIGAQQSVHPGQRVRVR